MDFDDFEFDLDPIEMGIALGFGEELAEDERERHRLQREMEQGNDLLNDVDRTKMPCPDSVGQGG